MFLESQALIAQSVADIKKTKKKRRFSLRHIQLIATMWSGLMQRIFDIGAKERA